MLIELQRNGVQIFLATHDYVVLKEIDLQIASDDRVAFHSLYQDSETGEIAYHTTSSYLRIQPNAISEAFDSLYDREIERTIKVLTVDYTDGGPPPHNDNRSRLCSKSSMMMLFTI